MLKEKEVMENLVGLSEGEAAIILEQHGYVLRRIAKGDRSYELTADYQMNRVNVEVDNDLIITKMKGIY